MNINPTYLSESEIETLIETLAFTINNMETKDLSIGKLRQLSNLKQFLINKLERLYD